MKSKALSRGVSTIALRTQRAGGVRVAALAVAGALGAGAPAIEATPATATERQESVDPTQAATVASAPMLDPDVYATLTPRQQRAVDLLRKRHGDEVFVGVEPPRADASADSSKAAFGIGNWFAQEVLSWGVGFGLTNGFNALGNALGLGSDPMAGINESLEELHSKVDGIQDELRQLAQAEADRDYWIAFANMHGESEEEADDIQDAADDIGAFEEIGAHPTADSVELIADSTRDAMGDLGATLLTSAGTGSIPALMDLERQLQPVSDSEAQWERMLAGIDRYRGVYAQGIMNMLWAAQFDEEHGSQWGIFAKSRAESAAAKIGELYDYVGAPYPQHPGHEQKWMHVNGLDWALAPAGRPEYLDERTTPLTEQGQIAGPMQTLADNYRQVEGVTLEGYMTARDIPTEATLADTYRGTCFRTYRTSEWELFRTDARITGDAYSPLEILYADGEDSRACQKLSDEYLQPKIDADRAAVRANPQLARVDISTNPRTGMPALLDDESIRAQRDGLKDLVIERGEGGQIDVGFVNTGYDSLQIVPFGGDEPHTTIDLRDGVAAEVVDGVPAPEGGVELRLGYAVENDIDVQDTRATSVVSVNPDATSATLDITADSNTIHAFDRMSSRMDKWIPTGSGEINVTEYWGRLVSDDAAMWLSHRIDGQSEELDRFTLTELTFDVAADGELTNIEFDGERVHADRGKVPIDIFGGNYDAESGTLTLNGWSSPDLMTMVFTNSST